MQRRGRCVASVAVQCLLLSWCIALLALLSECPAWLAHKRPTVRLASGLLCWRLGMYVIFVLNLGSLHA